MQKFEGTIVSNKTVGMVVVTTNFIFHHKKYKKILTKTTRVSAHTDIADLKIGDKVELTKSRPYSKTIHFVVLKKIK